MSTNFVFGTTGKYIDNKSKDVFFRPYSSTSTFSDVASRTASIVVAPFAFVGVSVFIILDACVELFNAVVSLFKGNLSDSGNHLKEAGSDLMITCTVLLTAALSPLVNFVDAIGSVVTTFTQKDESNQYEESPSPF